MGRWHDTRANRYRRRENAISGLGLADQALARRLDGRAKVTATRDLAAIVG